MKKTILKGFLILLVYVPMTSTDIFVPLLPRMMLEFHTNTTVVSMLINSYIIGLSISMLISGTLSDIYGRRTVLLINFIIYTVSCILISFSTNIYLVIALRMFQGFGGGCGAVISRLIVKDMFNKNEQISVLTTISAYMALAPAIAPQIGVLIASFSGWRGTFVATSLLGLILIYCILFHFKETKTSRATYNPLKHLPTSFIQLFKSTTFVSYTMLTAFSWSAYFIFIGLSSFLFQHVYMYSEYNYAFVMAAVTLGYFLGILCTKFLNMHGIKIEQIINIGIKICLAGAPFLLISYTLHFPIAMIISMFIIRFGIGLIMPTAQVGVLNEQKDAGWAVGCLFCVEFIIGVLSMFIASLVDEYRTGLGMILMIMLSILLLYISKIKTLDKQETTVV